MSPKRKVLETWFKRVWTDQESKAIDEMFIIGGEAKGLGLHKLSGPEDFKLFHIALCRIIKDIQINIDHFIEQGDWTSAIITIKAKSVHDDKDISFTGNVYGTIENGQITQAHNHLDFMGLFGQLGYLPEDCFERGLSGSVVT